jgi:type IV pilus assembly protein PilW
MFDARQTRVYDMETDLVSVSYYLKLRDHLPANGQPQRLVSTLMRRENGNDVEIAPGVERLDFLFHVERGDGTTAVLPADQVGADPSCRSAELPAAPGGSAPCGWRSLKGVEVFLLVNSVDDAVPNTGKDAANDTFRYAWLNDGTPNTADVFETSSAITRLPNGLPPGRQLRKGFRTFVALRGYNH